MRQSRYKHAARKMRNMSFGILLIFLSMHLVSHLSIVQAAVDSKTISGLPKYGWVVCKDLGYGVVPGTSPAQRFRLCQANSWRVLAFCLNANMPAPPLGTVCELIDGDKFWCQDEYQELRMYDIIITPIPEPTATPTKPPTATLTNANPNTYTNKHADFYCHTYADKYSNGDTYEHTYKYATTNPDIHQHTYQYLNVYGTTQTEKHIDNSTCNNSDEDCSNSNTINTNSYRYSDSNKHGTSNTNIDTNSNTYAQA